MNLDRLHVSSLELILNLDIRGSPPPHVLNLFSLLGLYIFSDFLCNENVFVLYLKSYLNINVPWPVWPSWLEAHPMHWKVAGSAPGQGAHLGCGFDPCGGPHGRQPVGVFLIL